MDNPRLEYWSIIIAPARGEQNGEHHDIVFAMYPNRVPVCLIGRVYNHPTIKDESIIVTPVLTDLNELDEVASTHSRDYDLGQESPKYKEFRERKLLESK